MWILLTIYLGINVSVNNLGEYTSKAKCEKAYMFLTGAAEYTGTSMYHVCVEK
jgi:hypothetical protein